MDFLKKKNKWTPILLAMLLVVLGVAAFLPILPDSVCGRISYATLLKNEWNKHHKSAAPPAGGITPVTSCKK